MTGPGSRDYHKLVKGGLRTREDMARAARLYLINRHEKPKNLFIGPARPNSSEGSQMRHRRDDIKRQFASSGVVTPETLSAFRKAALDVPTGRTDLMEKLEKKHKAAWDESLSGKYRKAEEIAR